MIELFFTCYLYANGTLKPGPEFEVLEITAYARSFTTGPCYSSGGNSITCPPNDSSTIVKLKRKAKPGETIKPPDDCEMKIEKEK